MADEPNQQRYSVVEEIGKGGMGAVFLVEDTESRRRSETHAGLESV